MLLLRLPLLEVSFTPDLLNLKKNYFFLQYKLFYVFPGVDKTQFVVVIDGWAISPPWIAW